MAWNALAFRVVSSILDRSVGSEFVGSRGQRDRSAVPNGSFESDAAIAMLLLL